MELICCLCRPPGTVPELHKKDRVVLGAGRCIPMGIVELLLLDVPLDLEVKPELLRQGWRVPHIHEGQQTRAHHVPVAKISSAGTGTSHKH